MKFPARKLLPFARDLFSAKTNFIFFVRRGLISPRNVPEKAQLATTHKKRGRLRSRPLISIRHQNLVVGLKNIFFDLLAKSNGSDLGFLDHLVISGKDRPIRNERSLCVSLIVEFTLVFYAAFLVR